MKRLTVFLVALCLAIGCTMPAFAVAQSIVLNGTPSVIPSDMGEMIEQDDRTFVPIRFVSENMGKTVKYDENINAALILDKSDMYIIQDGATNIYKISDMGETVVTPMDTPVFVKQYDEAGGGRMYVPIRFVSEAFGYSVGWDPATETVTIDEPAE